MNEDEAKIILKELIILAIIVSSIYLSFSYGLKLYLHNNTPIMVVVSGSMVPTININDLIIVKGVDPRILKEGDIIVFHDPRFEINPTCGGGHCIVHRIIKVINTDPPQFKTKGDANMLPDPFTVDSGHVIGEVVLVIPKLGIVTRVFKPPYNYLLVIIILIAFILYEANSVFRKTTEEEIVKSYLVNIYLRNI